MASRQRLRAVAAYRTSGSSVLGRGTRAKIFMLASPCGSCVDCGLGCGRPVLRGYANVGFFEVISLFVSF